MRTDQLAEVQKYLQSLFPDKLNPLLEQAKKQSELDGTSGISMAYPEMAIVGQLLKFMNLEKIIEIGTLNGYSGLAILNFLSPHGQLWTFEKDPQRAQFAESLLKKHCLLTQQKATVICGDAELKLSEIESQGPFDAIFIDGNKAAYFRYLEWAEKNIKKNGFIFADNVFLSGAVYLDPQSAEFKTTQAAKFNLKQISVMKKFNERLADANLYDAFLVPTTEGLYVARKKF